MIEKMRELCRKLLSEGAVDVVIGYGQTHPERPAHAVFVRRSEDVGQLVWNDLCLPNLTAYLTRKEIKALGRPAIIVKGCDEKALVVLEKESQIKRDALVVIGMACERVGRPRAAKCAACDVHMPRLADHTIGQVENPPVDPQARYVELETFLLKTPEERMAYWRGELGRCVKCYACRQVCPMCYCEQCLADKNRPQRIDTSTTLKGTFAWHITRAFHQAGRCVGCDECVRACPAGIDLRLLNLSLAKEAEEGFDYRAGMNPEAEPCIGSYSLQDKESFIQ